MFRKTAFGFLLTLTPFCAIAETAVSDDIAYPAPPGVYGNPELLMMFDEPQASPEPTPEPVSEQQLPPGPTQDLMLSLPEEPPAPLLIMQPPQPAQNSEMTPALPKPSPPAPQPAYRHYPDAHVLQKQMNEASQLEFSQWGFDDQGTASNNQSYPASAYEYGPEMFHDSYNYNQYFENPYPVSQMTYDNRSRSRTQAKPVMPDFPVPDYYSYGYDMMESTPSALKSQLPFENDLYAQPPVDPYLRQSEQYPLPESVYGMPGRKTQMPAGQQGQNAYSGSNTQYFRKIPEEEIIYPPNYPRNLR